jgi:hypothetical protein
MSQGHVINPHWVNRRRNPFLLFLKEALDLGKVSYFFESF